MTNRKSHTPFRLMPKINDLGRLGWPWTADMHSIAETMRLSEPTTKIWMKIGHTISANNVVQWLYFLAIWGLRGGSLERGRQTTVGLSTTAIFSVFAGYFFGNFREGQHYYIAKRSQSSTFQWSQNIWPRLTFSGYFALNSVSRWFDLAMVWPCELSKIIAWKMIKIDTYCLRCKSSAWTLVSCNISFVQIFGLVL